MGGLVEINKVLANYSVPFLHLSNLSCETLWGKRDLHLTANLKKKKRTRHQGVHSREASSQWQQQQKTVPFVEKATGLMSVPRGSSL